MRFSVMFKHFVEMLKITGVILMLASVLYLLFTPKERITPWLYHEALINVPVVQVFALGAALLILGSFLSNQIRKHTFRH